MSVFIFGGFLLSSVEVGSSAWAAFWLVRILGHALNLTGQPH